MAKAEAPKRLKAICAHLSSAPVNGWLPEAGPRIMEGIKVVELATVT